MGNRRFTRLTNAFTKKNDNHVHMLALYFTFYNFCRIHKTLRVTPAMAAGIDTVVHDVDWVVGMIAFKRAVRRGAALLLEIVLRSRLRAR
jgi:hypothetical protein